MEEIQRSSQNEPNIEQESKVIRGYAAVFGAQTTIYDRGPDGKPRKYIEQIARNAFDKSLAQAGDVISTFNHNEDALLGRTANGTLKIGVDAKGLWYEVSPPDTATGNEVRTLAARRDLRGSSFVGIIRRDSWNGNVRTILELDLQELGPVTKAAYRETTADLVAARSVRTYRARLSLRERALRKLPT